MYINKIHISDVVENGKYMNYQYNSEQMFIICSNRIKIKYNWLLETSCFNVHQKIKKKNYDLGIIEHGRYWNQAANRNHFSKKMCEGWETGVAKIDIDVVKLPLKNEKWIKK